MAALEVVKRNLDQANLGDACLELHSHKTRKKAVLEELERTLDLGRPRTEALSTTVKTLTQARDQLNAYCQAVNGEIEQSGTTPFQCYGHLLRLRSEVQGAGPDLGGAEKKIEIPAVELPKALTWTKGDFAERLGRVQELQALVREIGIPRSHPFHGSRRLVFFPADQAEIERVIERALGAQARLLGVSDALARSLNVNPPQTLREVGRLRSVAEVAARAPSLSDIAVDQPLWLGSSQTIDDV